MSTAVYTPTVWVNNTAPELAAGNLNHIEQGLKAVTDGTRALESVLVECEVYADNAQTSAIASVASASASEVSAVSAEASAVTAKEEADRAAAVVGIDIATESVAGLIKASSEIVVGIDGAPTLKQTDTSGLVGTAGLSATLQSLINYIADAVKTKLVYKTSISQTNVDDTTKVPSSALFYDLSESLTYRVKFLPANTLTAGDINYGLTYAYETTVNGWDSNYSAVGLPSGWFALKHMPAVNLSGSFQSACQEARSSTDLRRRYHNGTSWSAWVVV